MMKVKTLVNCFFNYKMEGNMKKIDFRSMIIGLLSGVCIFLMMGQNRSNMGDIKVSSISIMDGNHETVFLGSTVNHSGMIHVYNTHSKNIVSLGSSVDHAGLLELNDPDSKNMVFLGTSEFDDGMLTLNNRYGNQIAYLASNNEHNGMLLLSDRFGTDGWGALGTGYTFPE